MFERLEQITIEDTYSRKHIRARVRDEVENQAYGKLNPMFNKACDLIQEYMLKDYYQSKNDRIVHLDSLLADEILTIEDIVIDILIIIMPVNGPQMIQGACGKLAGTLRYPDVFDGVKTASELISVVCFSDLYDIIPPFDSETGSLMVKATHKLSDETMQYIANTQYMPPMICEPTVIKCNTDSAYLTIENDSIILGKDNHHNKYQALDAINIANSTVLALDEYMLQFEEVSKKPLDTIEKKQNFQRMKLSSKGVYQLLLDKGNKFHLTWKFGKRGRMYSQGYHVNIQSIEYKKSLISLHKKELIL